MSYTKQNELVRIHNYLRGPTVSTKLLQYTLQKQKAKTYPFLEFIVPCCINPVIVHKGSIG